MTFLSTVLALLLLVISPSALFARSTDSPAFIVNNPDKAFALAKERGQAVMIEFSAIWCPPCLKLEQDVFGTPEFKSVTKTLVKLKLDVDLDQAGPWIEKYKLRDYPSIVFADFNGNEVARIHGYHPAKVLVSEIRKLVNTSLVTVAQLRERADHGDQDAAQKVGRMYLNALEYADAEKYLALSGSALPLLAIARVNLAKTSNDGNSTPTTQEALITALNDATSAMPGTVDAIAFTLDLANVLKKKGETDAAGMHARKVIELASKLSENPNLVHGQVWIDASRDDMEVRLADLSALRATAFEIMGDVSKAKLAWKECVDQALTMVANPRSLSQRMTFIRYLKLADDVAQIDIQFHELQKLFPKDYIVFKSHANVLFKHGRYADAEAMLRRAVHLSYSVNKLSTNAMLVQVLEKEQKLDEARMLAAKTLAEFRPKKEKTLDARRSIASLETFQKSIDGNNAAAK